MIGYPYNTPSGFERNNPYFPRIEYALKTGNVNSVVSVSDAKVNSRVAAAVTVDDTYFQLLIDAATEMAEDFTKRDLLTKDYYAYLDYFPCYNYSGRVGIEIQRSKLNSIAAIEYLVDGVFQTVDPSIYYFTNDPDYSSIYLKQDQNWPTNIDNRKQCIRITFNVGYGINSTFVPTDLKIAILNHVTFMYQQRGDSGDAGFASDFPQTTISIYNDYKIYSLARSADNAYIL